MRLQSCREILQEALLAADPFVPAPWLITLEVNAAHQGRQLCAEVECLLQCQSVAKLMEDRAQDAVGVLLVSEVGIVANLLEPFLRLLDSVRDSRW